MSNNGSITKNKSNCNSSLSAPPHAQLSRSLTRQQTIALQYVPNVSPGTWLSTPCMSVLNRFNHHFIAIHPLLYIGYNFGEISMVNLWGAIESGQAKKYVTKTWKVVREPKSPQHAALIITRAISRLREQQYSGLSNNCEHYATWCFTGYSLSRQVHESVLNGISSGGAALAGAGVAVVSVPTVAVVGSAQIGSAGVVLSVSAATSTWPFVIVGGFVGAIVGYAIPKCMEVARRRKYRKKLEEKVCKRQSAYSLDILDEVVDVMDEINAIADDESVDITDLEELSIALDDIFKRLDKHFHRDHDDEESQDNKGNSDGVDDIHEDDDEKSDLLNKEKENRNTAIMKEID